MMLATLGIALPYARPLSLLDIAPWGTAHSRLLRLDSLIPGLEVVHRQGELVDLYFFFNDPAFEVAPQRVTHGDLDLAWLAGDSYFALLRR
jgi:hypothetical protein